MVRYIEYAKQENKARMHRARHVSPIPICRVWENAMAKQGAKERARSSTPGVSVWRVDQRMHLFLVVTLSSFISMEADITELFA